MNRPKSKAGTLEGNLGGQGGNLTRTLYPLSEIDKFTP